MTKRCIYVDDFLDLFYVASAGQDKMFVKVVEQVVEDTPTADVVEVVRCKDCQRSRPMIFDGFYYCKRVRAVRKADDFCSKGKRKGGEG